MSHRTPSHPDHRPARTRANPAFAVGAVEVFYCPRPSPALRAVYALPGSDPARTVRHAGMWNWTSLRVARACRKLGRVALGVSRGCEALRRIRVSRPEPRQASLRAPRPTSRAMSHFARTLSHFPRTLSRFLPVYGRHSDRKWDMLPGYVPRSPGNRGSNRHEVGHDPGVCPTFAR